MGLAVTHIILTIVILDLFRHYVFGKNKFPRYLLVVGGIAGLFPDVDISMTWIYNFLTGANANLHGLFTHSIIFSVLFLIMGVVLHYSDKMKWAKISYVISAGLFMHSFIDCLFGGYKSFLWPLNISTNFCPDWGISIFREEIDAIILVLWIIHEEAHNKIKDYI